MLEGGLDWRALSLSPKDMDFIEAKSSAAREIALAFGVPPLLLGLPGDNTRANYEEANRAFWRQTVIPLVARMQKSFAAWLQPAFGDFIFDYDVDRIDALAGEREKEWTRLGNAAFLTDDEKREAVGYGRMKRRAKDFDAVDLDVGNSQLGDGSGDGGPGGTGGAWQNQPRVPAGNEDGGQWTAGGGGDAQLQNIAESGNAQGYRVDLIEEEARGGHTYERHINKSDEYLMERMSNGQIRRAGAFSSLDAANSLTSSTLAQNSVRVDRVASNAVSNDFVTAEFGSVTGREAYRDGPNAQPYFRTTTGVGVYLVHDPRSALGFTVISAYPRRN